MPSKNRKHFAIVGTDSRVIDSVSSDSKNYLWAIVTPGKKTKWLEEYDENTEGAHAVYQTDDRLAVGEVSRLPSSALEAPTPPAPETAEQYHEQVQAARSKLSELKPIGSDLAKSLSKNFNVRQPANKPAAQRVYKTGQRYTKPGTGVIAKVFLVKEDGRAYARGNRRGLTRVLLDDSWELAR